MRYSRLLASLGIALLSVAAARAEDIAHTIKTGGHERHYRIHVPASAGTRTMPLVVMLHGGGGSGRGAEWQTGWNAKADREGFLVAYPDALPRDPKRAGALAGNPPLWNDGSGRFASGRPPPDDTAFLDAVLDDVASKYPVDSGRVYATGFSNGASMAFLWGAKSASRLAALAPVAGAAWEEPGSLARPLPMLYITGDADPLNVLAGGPPRFANGSSAGLPAKAKPPVRETIAKWVKANGCEDVRKRVSESNGVRTETWGPCLDGAEVTFVKVVGLGHAWAGGRSALPESLVGKGTDRLDATDVIWAFFGQHMRR